MHGNTVFILEMHSAQGVRISSVSNEITGTTECTMFNGATFVTTKISRTPEIVGTNYNIDKNI